MWKPRKDSNMKFDWTTFPKLVADPTTNEQKIIEWVENHKAELREILPKFGTIGEVILEEILGER